MKKIVMTGITSGIGLSWLYQLDQELEAEFFLILRNKQKFDQQISHRPLQNRYHVVECSLDSLHSVNTAAGSIQAVTDSVDILVNNAGIWPEEERTLNSEGLEVSLAVNHLAPFLLSGRLLPQLKNAPSARIINTSSFRHGDARVDMNDIGLRNGYSAARAYCNSKLYNILFTRKLAELLGNSTVTINCFDPGMVDTPMFPRGFPKPFLFLYPFMRRHVARTPEKGAETGLYLSTAPECREITGAYFRDCRPRKTGRKAEGRTVADWLWHESVSLTGFSYPFP